MISAILAGNLSANERLDMRPMLSATRLTINLTVIWIGNGTSPKRPSDAALEDDTFPR
jgi:hypothetical protein